MSGELADEGPFACDSDVQFRAPVLAGDVLEVTATVTTAIVVSEPVIAVTAVGTVVVPPRGE